MDDTILEMRNITKTFPGVKALENVNLAVRTARRDPRHLRRERRRQVHPHEGAVGRTPRRFLRRRDRVRRQDGALQRHPGQRSRRALSSFTRNWRWFRYLCPIAENIFLGNERRGFGGLIDWNLTNAEAGALLESVGLSRESSHPGDPARCRQAAAGRDRQGTVQRGYAAHPGRADRRPSTTLTRLTCSTCCARLRERGITCIMISHKLNEITAIADSTTVIRDGRTVETLDMSSARTDAGPHHSRNGRPRPRQLLPRPGLDAGRGGVPDRGLDGVPSGSGSARWSTAPPSTCAAGEVVGIAGLMGAGRTELAMSVFGRSYGRDIRGRVFMHGQEVKARTVAEAISQRHRLRHRGPQALRAQPGRRRLPQRLDAAALGKLSRRGLGQRQRRDQGGRAEPPRHDHQDTERA